MNSKELFNAIIDFYNNDPLNEEKFTNDYRENEHTSVLIFGVGDNIIIIKETLESAEDTLGIRQKRVFDQALKRILSNNFIIFKERQLYDLIILNGLI
jgi:hypothetical protein